MTDQPGRNNKMESHNTYIPDLDHELVFQTSRSSGPGGQNVNKVNTRVELRFDIPNSQLLTVEQKEIVLKKLASKVTAEGILIIVSQAERSQLKNKELAITRLYEYLNRALKPVKKRRRTRPSRTSVEKRLQKKNKHGEKKSLRGRISLDE